MSLERKYKLNMPQLLWGGLSENWLMKELGDAHWQQITSALGTASDELVDSRGERLYASFVRLSWSGVNISHFSENENMEMKSKLSRYGSKMFFSETVCSGSAGKLKAKLLSVFSTRESSDNTQLKKGALKTEIDSNTIKVHRKLPVLAKEYLENKMLLFDKNGGLRKEAYPKILYRQNYKIDAYDDINGVGLLYFASYPKINDKCEREYMHFHYSFKGDWLEAAGVISRDIHYYGNANPDETLIYELNTLKEENGKVKLNSSLYRSSDKQLIARIYTTKELADGVLFKRVRQTKKLEKKQAINKEKKEKKALKNKNEVNYSKEFLNDVVIGFLESMLDIKDLTVQSDLSALGIESIVYQELSEFLFEQHTIDSNPSRFYGISTIHGLTDYLLGIDSSSVVSEDKIEVRLQNEPVAVIGMSGRFPGAPDIQTFWEHIRDNKDLISEVSIDRWNWKNYNVTSSNLANKTKSKWGGFIEGIAEFDPLFFGISPYEAELMDPQQRIMLQAVYSALEDAAIVPKALKGTNTGVYIGVSGSDYTHLLRDARKEKVEAYDSIGTATSILVNRISYLLDIYGPSQAIDTACSSSLVAIHEAVKSIKDGSCDVVIAGGINAMLRPELTLSYDKAGMLSEDGRCKTFDEQANGYVRGEGVGIVILKSLKKAIQNGDRIYGIIKGSAINHGGKANTLTSPNPLAQKALLVKAYNSGNIDPREVSYIEAHGTGTPLGDPIEIEGLKLAFDELYSHKNLKKPQKRHCGIGSVKTNIGHLEAAAGIAGFIKVLLCMQNQTLPGNSHLKTENKYIDLNGSPFYLRKETSEWKVSKNHKRIAGVSSFGFGGVNAHIVLEEFQEISKPYQNDNPVIILLSAKNSERLKERASDLRNYLEINTNINLHNLAYTLQYGREEMEERLAFVASNHQELRDRLWAFESGNFNKLYRGNAKRDNCDFLLEGEAGEAYMQIIISKQNYQLLAQLWAKGTTIEWGILYDENNLPKRIGLPAYPFSRKKYWVTKPEIQSDQSVKSVVSDANITSKKNLSAPVQDTNVDTTVEIYLMTLLKKVLKLEKEDIDFTIDISDYGIDSIMSSLMIEEIREIIPEVPPLLFLEYRSFNDIVSYLVSDFPDSFKNADTNLQNVNDNAVLEKSVELPIDPIKSPTLGNHTGIAIIGISGILPQSENIQRFSEHLEKGNVLTENIPKKRLELLGLEEEEKKKLEQFYGGFVDDIENFDYKKFNFSKEEAIQIDPQLRKLIESVWLAIADSGYKIKNFQKIETGVFTATKGHSGYLDIMKSCGYNYEAETPALYANRLSHVFNLKGPSEVVDTACSSFIAAIERAFHAFQRGDCKQAIVATATLNLSYYELIKEDLTGVHSKQGITKSFGEDADGFVRSETIGTVIIKPLKEAVQDGDHIYGIVKGVGVYHGGKSPLRWNSPNIKGQKKAIEKALSQSQIDPLTVDYIEAEANGVSFVDSSEMVSIQSVYGSYFGKSSNGQKDKTIFIGSLKPLMGHAEASSTFPCLLKLILSTQKKKLFGVKGLTEINGAINIKDHFSILKNDINWQDLTNKNKPEQPKRMAMNCLGIGGVNTHLIFEEYIEVISGTEKKKQDYIFLFSDESETQLHKMMQKFIAVLPQLKQSMPEYTLLDRLEYTLLDGRKTECYRLAIMADSLENLLKNIEEWITGKEMNSNNINNNCFYNFGKIEKVNTEKTKLLIDQMNWRSLATDWVQGAVVNWKETNYTQTSKRISIPAQSLKELYAWPFEISENFKDENIEDKILNLYKHESIFELASGKIKSPYQIKDNYLFLFNRKWKETYSNSLDVNNDEIEHQVIACYLKKIVLDSNIDKNFKLTIENKPVQYDERSFTVLAQTMFLYIQNLLKQKPKKTICLQIILPISCIDYCYGISGLIYTSRQESTKIKTQLIFVDEEINKPDFIEVANENKVFANKDLIIKYEQQIRYVEYSNMTGISDSSIEFNDTYKKGEVLLITGGLGGLGLLMTQDIIKHDKEVVIILAGRSELNEKRRAQIQNLNKGTSQVIYCQSDISKEKEVKNLIRYIVKNHGTLNGIIHCAGVIRDNYIFKKTIEEIQTVFLPKVHGVSYLDRYTKDLPLRFFLCFSSVHSLGNPGQADYAMANAYLDGFIRQRNKMSKNGERSGKAMAVNWPYWQEGGMQLSEMAIELMKSTKGSMPLPTKTGMSLLHYVIQTELEQIFVDLGSYEKIIKQHSIHLNKEEPSSA